MNLCDGVGRPRGSRQWTSSRPPSGITRGLDSDAGGSSESSLSSSTSTNIHKQHRPTVTSAALPAVFQVNPSYSVPPRFTSSACSETGPLGISGTGFYAPDAIPDTLLLRVPRKLTENQSADPKQWSCLILSSSITGLLVRGALLSLLRLCGASNHVQPGV